MELYVCVGTNCHLRGSEEVIQILQQKIRDHHLEEKLHFKGSFCMNRCDEPGVSVGLGDEFLPGVTSENAARVFDEVILVRVKR